MLTHGEPNYAIQSGILIIVLCVCTWFFDWQWIEFLMALGISILYLIMLMVAEIRDVAVKTFNRR